MSTIVNRKKNLILTIWASIQKRTRTLLEINHKLVGKHYWNYNSRYVFFFRKYVSKLKSGITLYRSQIEYHRCI